MSAPPPAYRGFPSDGLQALMSGAGPGPPAPEHFSATGFGSVSASAPALLIAAESATASATAAATRITSNDTLINSTSTSTPTPRPISTLAGLARQQTQALAALHSAFTSPHYFSTNPFAAHLPNVNLNNPRLPNANGFFDNLATTNFPTPPNFLQPPFFSPLHRRACELHVLSNRIRPASAHPATSSAQAPHQFGIYFQAQNSEVEVPDLRRGLENIPDNGVNSSADDVQEQDGQEEEIKDELGRIAAGSLLDDNMPAVATSRKRNRAAAALDETAGPATVKRPRSQSGGTSVSSRKPVKPRRTVPTVVIPDSDDIFAVEDDDGKQELFDLTENDTLPEEQKVVKEDTSTKLCKFECIICLDAASTLTVTHCGHMFCGPCLHQAMHAEVTKKICPMCRQKLDTRPRNSQPSKAAKTFFHLEMKLKLSKSQGKQPVRPMRRA
ncbi:hypothetical protein N0V82_001051 [Gnomoniopsis sp. IMI 355080]|nr:hypothetical protein N0V82_001051 [Gnomoniopsis sp. IMI 355080]